MSQTIITRRQLLRALTLVPAAGLLASCAGGAPAAAPSADTSSSASKNTSDPIYYGVSGPFTGNNAEYGRIWKQAMTLALDEVNAAGGIKGRKVELVFEDSQSDPKQSVPVAQKFVNDPRILAELGDFASPASMAASPIYQRARMVQFGFTNSHPDFTKGGDFMFSIVASQKQDAAAMADAAYQRLGKKQAVLYRNTDWGKVTHQIYVDRIKELGGEVVAVENYLEGEKDFKPILAKVRDASPEVVALISYYTDGALIMQQAWQAGLNAKFIANGASYSPQFLKLGQDAVEGVMINVAFFPGDTRPEVQNFAKGYEERYKEDPDQFAALSYDAVKIIAWAAQQAGVERAALQQALANGTEIPSVVHGPFKFGPDRRPEKIKTAVIQVRGGKFVFAG